MEILTLHCDIFGKTKYLFYYSTFSANQPKTHSLNIPFQINPVSAEFSRVTREPHSAEVENSLLYYFQPHQLKQVQTTSTNTEDPASTGGAVPAQLMRDAY